MTFPPLVFARDRRLDWSRPYVAGVLNCTPDSFSDGGEYAGEAAVRRGLALCEHGADIVDVGGESTRPGATPVSADDEIARVVPVIRALREQVAQLISVDTTKAAVARAALAAGADIVNDISGGAFDPAIAHEAAEAGAAYICGHVRGRDIAQAHAAEATPPRFDEVVNEIAARVAALPRALHGRTIADPCLGFGKRTAENLTLCRRAGELAARVGCPVMIGPSRKRFIGAVLVGGATGATDPRDPRDPRRDAGTVGACIAAVAAGAHIVRVHAVDLVAPAIDVFRAIQHGA